MTVPLSTTAGEKFQLLVNLMAQLRAPGGCPWDREQTFDTIKPYLLEETYEVLDAIDARDWPELAGELGDLLLQAVFFLADGGRGEPFPHRGRARRHQSRSWSAGIRTSSASETAHTGDDVRKIWSEVKAKEKQRKGSKRGCSTACRAHAAGAGRGAADHLPRRRRRLRLGERRAGARQAARRTGRVRFRAPVRLSRAARRRAGRPALSCW